jgi:hypothetical protein
MPERVRYAMLRQAINHRGAEFGAVYADIVRVLRMYFGTANDLLVLHTHAPDQRLGDFSVRRVVARHAICPAELQAGQPAFTICHIRHPTLRSTDCLRPKAALMV